MFNTFYQEEEKKDLYKERNHQDNFASEGCFNNNFQYCRFCDKYVRFEYDRCCECKNN